FNLCSFQDLPEAVPLKEFLSLQRERVTPEEFQAYVKVTSPKPPLPGVSLETTRVLDIHLAALLWRLFGIRWQVLFTFYALVGTLTCFLMFLIGRKLGGSYAAGLLAALLYLFSPLENYGNAWSIRDTSPLWFTSLSFFLYFCVV